MRFILILFLLGAAFYFAIRIISSLLGRFASPPSPVVMPPAGQGVDISITDAGTDGLPVITIRSNGATLNIQSLSQDAGHYVVSAEKKADNVAVISVIRKT